MNKLIKGAFVLGAFIIGITPLTFAKFTDLIEIGNYTKAIENLVEKGVINGYPDNTFRPSGKITRAEFVKMMVMNENLKMNSSESLNFTDVENHWAKEFIDIASSNHMIKGYEDNSFKPDKEITYAEVSSILLNLLEVKELNPELSWHEACVSEAGSLGILDGITTNDLLGINPARRDNVALMIWNKSNLTISDKENNQEEITDENNKDDDGKGNNSSNEQVEINTRELHLGIVKEEFSQNSEPYFIIKNLDGEEETIKLYSKSAKPSLNSFIVYTFNKNGEMKLQKQLLLEEIDDVSFVVEKIDDGLIQFKNEKRLFDLSAEEYETDGVEIELDHYIYYYAEMNKNEDGIYEFISLEEIEKENIHLEKQDRICFDEETEIALVIKGIEEE